MNKNKRPNISELRGQAADERSPNIERAQQSTSSNDDESEKTTYNMSLTRKQKERLRAKADAAGAPTMSAYIVDELDLDETITRTI